MQKNDPCPCRDCPCALTCWWTCDELNAWAEDKTFAQVADEFINAYKRAEKQTLLQKIPQQKLYGKKATAFRKQ